VNALDFGAFAHRLTEHDGRCGAILNTGLFQQYLTHRQSPRRQTIADVKKFIRVQSPHWPRLHHSPTSMRAIYYLIVTAIPKPAKAVPVTGGQVDAKLAAELGPNS